MKEKSPAKLRLERILKGDKGELPIRLEEVLKSEIYGLLFSYLDIGRDNIELEIKLNNDGKYEIKAIIYANSIKSFYQV